MTRTLRDYQAEDVERVRKGEADGRRRQAGVWATGLGKSSLAGSVATTAARRGERVLLLAHRAELLDQLTAACQAIDPGVPVGRIQAATKRASCPITVGMVDTMRRAVRPPDSTARPTWLDLGIERGHGWDRVIYDEFHHSVAPSNLRLLERLGVQVGTGEDDPDGTPLLGLTATLTRSDAHGLAKLVPTEDHVAFRRGIDWAVGHGWLVRPRGKVVTVPHLDLKGAKVTAGDYQDGQLGEMIVQDVDRIVDAWLEHAALPDGSHRITVAFTPTTAAAHELAAEFTARGIAAETVTRQTSPTERGDAAKGTGIYGRLAAGVTRVLVGVMVPTEGWDCVPVSCVLQCRPTRLEGLYQQMVGRGLRLSPETGKTDCLVLDVVGAARGQRLATLVDLLPDAEHDTSAIDALPCEVCTLRPCACEKAGRQERAPIVGPVVYEDLDLLMAESAGGAWLATYAGHPFLVSETPFDRRVAVIFREEAGGYRVGHVTMRGELDARRLGAGLTLDEARTRAEAWCRGRNRSLAAPGAKWRTESRVPTIKAQRRALRLQVADPLGYTGRELSELMDTIEVSARVDALGPGAAANAAGRSA